MGERGPIPRRTDEKVRRNKDEGGEVEKLVVFGKVEVPELDLDTSVRFDPEYHEILPTHPIAEDLYRSLTESAQARFFEPSDWHLARFALHFANQLLWSSKPNGQVLATVAALFSELLMSEGSRRRLRLEIERNPDQPVGQVIDVSDRFRAMLTRPGASGDHAPEGS